MGVGTMDFTRWMKWLMGRTNGKHKGSLPLPVPGSRVRLRTPDNRRLHGALAVVETLEPWGARVRTAAAGSGQYRALFEEMEPDSQKAGDGYTGDVCSTCGGARMRRAGACLVCEDCGANSGCG